jgi:hypothetical protein
MLVGGSQKRATDRRRRALGQPSMEVELSLFFSLSICPPPLSQTMPATPRLT